MEWDAGPRPQDNSIEVDGTDGSDAIDMDTPWALTLQEKLIQKFEQYMVVARESFYRRPIKKPKGEIPQELLEVGNRILVNRIPEPNSVGNEYLSKLNVYVYAMGRAIAIVTDSMGQDIDAQDPRRELKEAVEIRNSLRKNIRILGKEIKRWRTLRRTGHASGPRKKFVELANLYALRRRADTRILLREFRDQLSVTRRQIRKIEQSQRIRLVRRGGYSRLARLNGAPKMEIPVARVRDYWKSIIGKARPFHPSYELRDWARKLGNVQAPVRTQTLSEEQWKALFSKTKPWKAAGPDGIPAFFWKHLPAARAGLQQWCNHAWARPRRSISKWLCRGKIALLPKECQGERGPGDFRPIACLNTCYKILTATIALQISLVTEHLIPVEQVAMRKGIWGCTHAHILDQTVIRDSLKFSKELHMLWVDFSKAFDSVSHGAVRWTLAQWRMPADLRRLLSTIMSKQTVRYFGFTNGKLLRSRELKVRNGLMQGDTLSPLLFCIAISPISTWLRMHVRPYRTSTGPHSDGALEINHIFYMDDLKVYTTSWQDLAEAKNSIKRIAGQIGLELNARKCAVRSLNCADIITVRARVLDTIPVLGATELYRYLGAEQSSLTCIGVLLDRVERRAKTLASSLFLSELTVSQKVAGYNMSVMPKLRYAYSCVIFGAGKWRTLRKRAEKFDTEIRQLMKTANMRFQTSCAARLYVNKEVGGLGMKTAVEELERSIAYTWCYLASNADLQASYELAERLRLAGKRSLTSDFHTVLNVNGLEGRVKRTIIATIMIDDQTYFGATEAARALSALIRKRWSDDHEARWKSKSVASRVVQGPDGEHPAGLCMKDSFLWSARGWVASEVLRNVWAAQEGALLTRSSPAGRASMPHARGVCRMDCSPDALETAEHIVSSCSHWRANIMVDRHDDVARVMYNSIR
ncbi:reverse transcriptase, partial [Oesophagostomum dentatum]